MPVVSSTSTATGEEARPERVADAGRVDLSSLRHHADVDRGAVGADDVDTVGSERGDPQPDLGHDVGVSPAGLGQHQVPLVVIAEQVGGAVDKTTDLVTGQPGQLLGGVGGEGQSQLAALVGVSEHRVRIVGADDDQFRLADIGDDVGQLDVSRLGHRAGIEGGDLRHVEIGGADEPGGVLGIGDEHGAAVDTGGFQPLAIVGEVDAGRAHQCRVATQDADRVGHVSGHAATVHDEVVDQKAQRDLLQVLGKELL